MGLLLALLLSQTSTTPRCALVESIEGQVCYLRCNAPIAPSSVTTPFVDAGVVDANLVRTNTVCLESSGAACTGLSSVLWTYSASSGIFSWAGADRMSMAHGTGALSLNLSGSGLSVTGGVTAAGTSAINLSDTNGRITWTTAGRYLNVNEGTGNMRFNSLGIVVDGDVDFASSTSGSCTLSSGTPSTCAVALVTASSFCVCSPVGTTAAVAAAGCAVSLSGTTLTITGPDTVTTTMNYHCFK
jgi:hypothetical protein